MRGKNEYCILKIRLRGFKTNQGFTVNMKAASREGKKTCLSDIFLPVTETITYSVSLKTEKKAMG